MQENNAVTIYYSDSVGEPDTALVDAFNAGRQVFRYELKSCSAVVTPQTLPAKFHLYPIASSYLVVLLSCISRISMAIGRFFGRLRRGSAGEA